MPCVFHIRWILVNVACEKEWESMSKNQRRSIHALFETEGTTETSYSDECRLGNIGIRNGTVFHLYAIEDERFGSTTAKGGSRPP